jgi:hypothetical protein
LLFWTTSECALKKKVRSSRIVIFLSHGTQRLEDDEATEGNAAISAEEGLRLASETLRLVLTGDNLVVLVDYNGHLEVNKFRIVATSGTRLCKAVCVYY